MRDLIHVLALVWLAKGFASAPQQTAPARDPLVAANATVKVSPHVYVIPDNSVPLVPNVGFVIGTRGSLVIDTGLGTRNGETVVRELGKISGNADLYVAATHFHPEHAAGGAAFPPAARFIRSQAQQKDIDELGREMNAAFSSRSPVVEDLLKNADFRRADVVFEREHTLDLGGVRVQMFWFGPMHTRGDTIFWIDDDRVLFAGDVVMKAAFPAFTNPASSVQTWLATLDRLDALRPQIIVPSHGPMGDASLISAYRDYLRDVQTRVRELKSQGKSSDEAAQIVSGELQAKYAGWSAPARIAAAAKAAFAEAPEPARARTAVVPPALACSATYIRKVVSSR